jgi:hypothetical protein
VSTGKLVRCTALACVLLVVIVVPAAGSPNVGDAGPEVDDDVIGLLATDRRFTYSVQTRGAVQSDVEAFASVAADVLDDPRGWSLGGSVAFDRVGQGGGFSLILASPSAVAAAHEVCSPDYSCRVGDSVYINDRNWRQGTPAWRDAGGDLDTYRQYLVNHEVGHWLGFGHVDCGGSGRAAPVMQQQSISLDGCLPSGWPLSWERERLGERLGVPVQPAYTWVTADLTGDGADEVAGFSADTGAWLVGVGQGDELSFSVWGSYATRDGWQSHVVGDFSGDGADQIASYHPRTGTWWVSTARDGALTTSRWGQFARTSGWQTHVVGDLSGDGADQIASYHPSNGTWWVSTADGGSFTTSRAATFSTTGGWDTHVVGDLSGDGADQIASYHPSNGTWWVSTADGTSFSTSRGAAYGTTGGWQTHLVADVLGDGAHELLSFHPSNGTWWGNVTDDDGSVTTRRFGTVR